MYCKKCGQQIDDNASFCAYCGHATNETSPSYTQGNDESSPERRKQKIVGIILAAFAALCILAIILINNSGDIGHTAPNSTDPIVTYIEISPQELFEQHEKNIISADNAYKGKTLKISGTIKDIGKDVLDNIYITLDRGEAFFSVQCYFDNSEAGSVGALEKGQNVTILGTCHGQTGNVIIKQCVISN